jgi:uncharacterized membrane protein
MLSLPLQFIVALLLFLAMDGIWFTFSTVYPAMNLSASRVLKGGGIAWAALALAHASPLVNSVPDGFLFGLLSYSIFNGTHYALVSTWPASAAVADTLWGTLTNSVVALVLASA